MNPCYFEHDADIGIIGRGETLEQSFEAAAIAVFAIMTELESVQPNTEIAVEFEEADIELALVTWLNIVIAKAREFGMVFSRFNLHRDHDRWHGRILGEKWRDGLERGVEVKGATLTMLSVKQIETIWESRCVVDV
ncbi:MAG: archease [Nitrosomonas sp. PRO4]|nr:archease [Nitrosomonas sp. PRO4]